MQGSRLGRRGFVASSTFGLVSTLVGCRRSQDRAVVAEEPKSRSGDLPTPSRDTDGGQFVQFLKDCTPEERVSLAQSLQAYPMLNMEDFGKYGLPPHEHFTDEPKRSTPERPMRPKSFNDLPAAVVLAAARDGRVNGEIATPYKIIGQLLYTCRNTIISIGSDRDAVNYHAIVEWVAKKRGVDQKAIESASTFELEQAVARQSLAKIWDRLNVEQRQELLGRLEQQKGTAIENKDNLAEMNGVDATAALGDSVAMSGLEFYTTMAIILTAAAGIVGIGIPMAAAAGAAAPAAILAGPPGWALLSAGLLGSLLLYAILPDAEKTCSFVITINLIKASRLQSQAGAP
jgi:uncharacterized protein YaaW (UPF0174 family)